MKGAYSKKKMSRKQNSLMKFSRSERLAQLSEQESVIQRKKREIEAKLEARKRKETEEALEKLGSSKETKHNKSDFSHKSSTWYRDEYSKERGKEALEKEEKQECLTNAFSNDGSFLDHFKKISSTGGLFPNFLPRKKQESDSSEKDDRDVFKNKREESYYEQRNRDRNNVKDRKDLESINTKQPYTEKKFSEPNIQMPLPPPGIAQLIPQQQNSFMMPSTSQQNPVPLIQYPNQSMQSSGLNLVPSFTMNDLQSKAIPSTSFIQTQQTLSAYQVPGIRIDTKQQAKSSFNQLSSVSELSSIQPPLPIKPQNIPPPAPIQVQNIPPPFLPPKETGKASAPLIKTKLKEFETDSSSSEDDSGYGKRFKRKQCSPLNGGNKSKEGSAPGSSVRCDSISLPQTTLRKEYSGVSSALYENDGDDEDEDDVLTETHHQLAELVARCGDDFEDSLRNKKENDSTVRFLSDRNSKQYLCYRKLVQKYRRNMKLNEKDKSEDSKLPTDKSNSLEEYDETREKMISKSRSEFRLAKEESKDDGRDSRGENASDKPREIKSRFDQKPSDGYQGSNEDLPYYKMPPESGSKEEGFSFARKQNSQGLEKEIEGSKAITKEENGDETKTEERRKRKRKSRWGDAVASSSNVETPVVGPSLGLQPPGALPAPKTNLLSQVTRSDPGLIQYARQTFGSTNLSEEDWKKAEDHYKINLLYQNLVRKRAEIDKLEKAGKFKYEYDSDEDVEGGTWEHKLRQQEMMATQMWAEELTRQAAGKHHIGDFLPPEELERFMEKYNAVKEGREPDLSDYKEFKLKEDNVGYRLLQKMGWDEGQGLGQDGSGIKNPVNKATTRHENQGLGIERPDGLEPGDDEYDAYRKRMMLAYRFRPNPLNNPRRPYY